MQSSIRTIPSELVRSVADNEGQSGVVVKEVERGSQADIVSCQNIYEVEYMICEKLRECHNL